MRSIQSKARRLKHSNEIDHLMKRELKCFATSVFKESYDASDPFNILFVSWEVALLLHVLNSIFKSF